MTALPVTETHEEQHVLAPGARVFAYPDGRVTFGDGCHATHITGVRPEDLAWLKQLLTTLPARPYAQLSSPDTATAQRRRGILTDIEHLIQTHANELPVPGLLGERIANDARYHRAPHPSDSDRKEKPGAYSRHQCSVWIDGLDRCGMNIAFGLAAAGIGRILSGDTQRVQPWDLGTTPLRITELGLNRTTALQRHIERIHPHTAVIGALELSHVTHCLDAVIYVRNDGLSPDELSQLAALDVPVLPVILAHDHARIGPFIQSPGIDEHSPLTCGECATTTWPLREDRTELSSPHLSAPETAQACVAAAIAVQHALHIIDRRTPPPSAHHSISIDTETSAVTYQPATCQCGDQLSSQRN